LGCPNWRPLLQQLIDTGKPFKFKQGLDERLLTDEKCELLFSANYDGDYTFAFDNVSDYELIKSKLQIIRRHTDKKSIKFYVLVGFEGTGAEDIENALLDTESQIALLKNIYTRLYDVLKNVTDINNSNAYVEFLADKAHEKEKEAFYDDVNKFIKQFSVCYSLYDFHDKMDQDTLEIYKKDLKRFVEIKKTTQLVLAEKVDFSKYKDQIMKLLDKYVSAGDVEVLSKEISLSDMHEFNQYIEDENNGLSDKSKADAILAQTRKVLRERYELQDEVFYGKFSEFIEKLLNDLKIAKKEDLASLLSQAKEIQKKVSDYEDNDIPQNMRNAKVYHPFYRNIQKFFTTTGDAYTQIIEHIVGLIKSSKVVDFQNNLNVKRKIFNELEDYLFDEVDEKLSADTIEQITETAWNIAVQNKDML
jgi:type I restriction enzyme R subunit